MGAEPRRLHVVFLPFMAHGHMIPTFDIARLFTAQNVEATIITTPVNAPIFTRAIGDPFINIEVFRFPTQEVGLPEGCENVEQAMGPGVVQLFFQAVGMLQQQLEQYLAEARPDCLVADMFFPWATESAAKFGIPRLVFHGFSYFSLSAQEIIRLYEPFKDVSSDDEPFTLPLLPHQVQMLRTQIPEDLRDDDKENAFQKRLTLLKNSEVESFGVIVNSFYELEPDYAEFFRKELGRRAWHIGPVSMCNRGVEKGQRGQQASIDEHECLTWLNSKKPGSVIYICFGSTAPSLAPQLHEIAMALESCGHNFIWVVRKGDDGNNEDWLPSGFEQRTKGKGLIIRGWAPQVLILEHEAVGAFVTHCGWNSTLEGISAGVPMVTWPIFAEQFYNEKLVTQVLQIGVSVGVKKWNRVPSVDDVISRKVIEKAMTEILEGEKAEEMRNKAKQLKEMASKAVAEGGSSHTDLSALINELRGYTTLKSETSHDS